MSSNLKKNILLIGASQMAIDYANVLIAMNANFDIVSRGKEKAEKFKSEGNQKFQEEDNHSRYRDR